MKTIISTQDVSLRNKFSFRYLLPLLFLLLSVNGMYAQQLIGQYKAQDGGFEGQVTGPLTILANIPEIDRNTTWKVNVEALSAAIVETGARSGNKFANVSFTSTSDVAFLHLQGPANTAISSGSHTIQFYYKGDKNDDGSETFGNIRAGIRGGNAATGTGTTIYAGGTVLNANQADWTKFTFTTNVTYSTTNGLATVQFSELNGKMANFDIDDVVIYLGGVDNAAPATPGTVTVSNPTHSSLDLSWGAASGGVDGGGYVVVRYATTPNEDNNPNQHGIYAIGNTTTNGTGSLTGTVRYVGTATTFTDNVGLSASTTYYYKVYTVDKAFNYSPASAASGATTIGTGVENQYNNFPMHVNVTADKQIIVNSETDLNGIVNIYNAFGQRMSSFVSNGTNTVISKPFVSGVYFVTLVVDGNKITKKVIVN